MTTYHVQFNNTQQQLKSNQELLHILLDDAEDMLREQPDEEYAPWLSAVVDKILENFVDQAQIEEDGNYLEHVLEQYPTWHSQIQHLQDEHQLLEGQLRDIAQRISGEAASGGITRECRRQLKDWIAWYRNHQHREIRLVQEAFVLEVGQGE